MAGKELFLLWIWSFRTQKINVRSALLVHISINLCDSGFSLRDSCYLVGSIANPTSRFLLSHNGYNSILKLDSLYRPGYNPASSYTLETKTIITKCLIIKKEIHFIILIIASVYIACIFK